MAPPLSSPYGSLYGSLFSPPLSSLFEQGHKYRGQLNRRGEPHGHGEMHFPNKDRYDGAWENGAIHGHGAYSEGANGYTYRGPFEYGQRHSQVIYGSCYGSLCGSLSRSHISSTL